MFTVYDRARVVNTRMAHACVHAHVCVILCVQMKFIVSFMLRTQSLSQEHLLPFCAPLVTCASTFQCALPITILWLCLSVQLYLGKYSVSSITLMWCTSPNVLCYSHKALCDSWHAAPVHVNNHISYLLSSSIDEVFVSRLFRYSLQSMNTAVKSNWPLVPKIMLPRIDHTVLGRITTSVCAYMQSLALVTVNACPWSARCVHVNVLLWDKIETRDIFLTLACACGSVQSRACLWILLVRASAIAKFSSHMFVLRYYFLRLVCAPQACVHRSEMQSPFLPVPLWYRFLGCHIFSAALLPVSTQTVVFLLMVFLKHHNVRWLFRNCVFLSLCTLLYH